MCVVHARMLLTWAARLTVIRENEFKLLLLETLPHIQPGVTECLCKDASQM